MTIQPIDKTFLDWTGDTLAIGLFEDAVQLTGDLATLDQKLAGILTELIAEEEFTGKVNSTIFTRIGAGNLVRKVILVGLGKPEALQLETLRRVAATVARTAKKQKTKTLGVSLPLWNNDPTATAQAITEGIELALYQDIRFKSEAADKSPNIE
ncbi:MAG: M17 family peptidase N-terminal domain-containing protein, partial [Dolichospermum sp.]